jgi:excisionase family DNA binding protein
VDDMLGNLMDRSDEFGLSGWRRSLYEGRVHDRAKEKAQAHVLPRTGEKLLTILEVAALLNVCRKTVEALIERGELKSVRVSPRRTRVSRVDLEIFIRSRQI